MDISQYDHDASIIKPVIKIEFDVLANDDIREISAMSGTHGIEIPDLYDKQEPKQGGLIDLRMGGYGDSLCATCLLDAKYCVGHSAHIDLAEAVFHPLYLKYVKTILDCICINCSNILIQKENETVKQILQIKSRRARLAKIHDLATKTKLCIRPQQGCGTPVSKIRISIKRPTSVINVYSELETNVTDDKGVNVKSKQILELTPEMISDIFDNISDEDCEILGMDPKRSRPSDMIHKVFLVPPVHVRPSLRGYFSGGSTMEDGLTHKLAEIIKANSRINKQKEINNENVSKYSRDHAHLLQLHVITYYDPDMITVPRSDNKGIQYKPLVSRFKGKGGRIRGNLMGKRGNFNARSVITSDPTISINHVGIPVYIAMTLTFPEIVTPYNYEEMTRLVKNGSDIYPGANFVFRGSSIEYGNARPIYLKFKKEKINLQYGDIVERHLTDGDIVLLNRQPTLHKQSMMGHRIKVVDDDTLLTYRLSVAVTPPYNADFDGDEMNIHVPQSKQTVIELEELADAKKQIITPSKSLPIIGIVQDGLLGAYNLTDEKNMIEWRDVMNLLGYTSFDDYEKLKKNKEYTGSDLFGLILPPEMSIKIKDLEIKNSKIIKGRLTKNSLGAKKKNNIIQYIWDEHGEDATKKFIDDCQRLINNFNLLNGFTVGVGDADVNDGTMKEIANYIENCVNKVDIDITNIENNPIYMTVNDVERNIFFDLNVVRDDVSKITMGSISDTNNFGIMINSGSKGGPDNLGQMAGCVGLQAFDGKLMPKTYFNRTLCYFHENDDRARSRGLCYSSYMDGLRYSEFCYHTKAARAGLIEQTVKTSDTGYAQRKLIKTMEDLMVKYDGTVRITGGQIIQQTYGGNGNDTTRQYEYKIKMISMDNRELEEKFKFTSNELENMDFTEKENEEHYNEIKKMRDQTRKNYVKAKLQYITMNDAYMLPVNLRRIISTHTNKKINKNEAVTPRYVIDAIENLLDIKRTPLIRVPISQKDNPPYYAVQDDRVGKTILRVALYDSLAPKKVINKYKMSKNVFDKIIEEIETKFNDNQIEPGEMVGIIAAQSLGEAVTQLTLDAFHHTGIAAMTHSTMGVPRVNELISATKNPKTPQLFVYLNKNVRESKEMANKISSYIENTTIGNIRDTLDVYYDPLIYAKGGITEKDGVSEPFYSRKITKTSCNASVNNLPWLIRITINKNKMMKNEVTLLDIKTKFCAWWNRRHVNPRNKKEKMLTLKKITSLAVLSNTDNDEQPTIHIRFNVKDLDKSYAKNGKKSKSSLKFNRQTIMDFVDLVDKFKLKGIDNVEKVNTIEKVRCIDASDGDSMAKSEEHVIYTSGVNLKSIRYISGIDIYRTYTDDVLEIYNTFGIEFARNRLLAEFLKAYENAGNIGLNSQHISLLVDIMCHTGSIISADRHGMNKSAVDPLSKASFEQSVDVLISASVFGDVDKLQGVSSRLYTGSVFKGGTGYCELVLDTKMIQNSEYDEKHTRDVKNRIDIQTISSAILDHTGGEDIFIPE